MINHVLQRDIDKTKWDNCIENSGFVAPYAYSWYLDIVSPNWNALIKNDYEAIMPLTHRTKWGIDYLFQPIACQQLGVFSRNGENISADSFFKAIPSNYKLIEVNLNYNNYFENVNSYRAEKRTNHTLFLSKSYQQNFDSYSRSHKNNIEKAHSSGILIEKNGANYEQFYKEIMQNFKTIGINLPQFKQKAYFNIFKHLGQIGELTIYSAHFNNEVLGRACFVTHKNWSTLDVYSNPRGKLLGAGYCLIDEFIREKSGNNLTLDFMGSSIPGVAYRNKGFGSIETQFTFVRQNRLPTLLRWLK